MKAFRSLTRVCLVGLGFCSLYLIYLALGSMEGTQCDCPKDFPVNPTFQGHSGDHHLCLIVPFRDRFEELQEFVPQISSYLNNKKIGHTIFVINQVDNYRFNRASLLNVGFLVSESELVSSNCDYVALHDVDLVPITDQLNYQFPSSGVFHVSAPGLHPKYDYSTFIGGILLITREIFRKVDGLSNHYWGWGLEDDEFYARLKEAKIAIERPANITTGRRDTFRHFHSARTRPRDMSRCYNQYEVTRKRDRETGLHTVKFSLVKKVKMSVEGFHFTLFNVALECDKSKTPWCDCTNAPPSDPQEYKKYKRDQDVIAPILKRGNAKPAKKG